MYNKKTNSIGVDYSAVSDAVQSVHFSRPTVSLSHWGMWHTRNRDISTYGAMRTTVHGKGDL